jgi:hypothetical protein
MRKNKFIIFGAVLLLLFGFFLTKNFVQASDEGDAIAVRIVPNPDHYSINEWYEKQGFTGSPQALIVDGYEAIRDGRTVYVGAANLKGNLVYTNVYLISYNQSSSDQTVDILGQIVKRWKFNTELENDGTSFSCSISSSACSSDADCATGQVCATSGIASSSCQLTTAKNCLLDSDCPDNFFCDSTKSKIIRDLDRIGTARDLTSSLETYKNLNGFYPKLEAGTYITNYTVSVWPSWTETFLSELSLSSFKDPINRLGACPGYDPTTCWNKDTKKFVYSPQSSGLILPAGSYGLVYKTDTKGSNYQLCSVMETKELGYTFEPNSSLSSSCVENTGVVSSGTFTNTAPTITDLYLVGEPSTEFNGSVKVVDAEGNPLTWSLNTNVSSWTGWSAAPVLKDTNMSNVKKIYAAKAGLAGTYNLSLTVSDGQGGVVVTTTPITIMASAPFIEAEDVEFTPSTNNNSAEYSFYVSSGNIDVSHSFYQISQVSGSSDFSFDNPSVDIAGENRYKITYKVNIPTNLQLTKDINYVFKIKAWDKNSAESTKDFKVTIKAENPSLIFNCQSSNRIWYPYSCLLGPVSQDGHTISYSSLTGLPAGLSINTVSSQAYLSGTPSAISDSNIVIQATNEYSLAATSSLPLKINNYCGDGVKQSPNTENTGGLYNDGYEDCDGLGGVTDNVASSSITNQYGCVTGQGVITPFPILNNSYCVYKSPVEGGGYCGDGYCQVKVGDKQMENACNCPQDCLSTMGCCGDGICTQTINGVPAENACNCPGDCLSVMSCCGDGLVTGSEVCDPKAPPAPCTDTFSQGLPSYCDKIPLSGTHTCNSDCTAWGACSLSDPVTITTNLGGCQSNSTSTTAFSCCQLLDCVNDGCGCCGRYQGDSTWLDLQTKAVNNGYSVKDVKSPSGGVCTVSSGDPTVCTCGAPGCSKTPLCPLSSDPKNKTNNSCVLAQSLTNLTNWQVLTNHTTADFKCWK